MPDFLQGEHPGTFGPSPAVQQQATHDMNPATGLSREQYRYAWMSSGISNMDQMRQWLAQNGGQVLSDNGTVQTPYGDTLDMGTAFRTGNGRPGWTPVNPAAGSAQGSQFGPSQQAFGQMQNQMQPAQNMGAMPYNPYSSSQNTGVAGHSMVLKPEQAASAGMPYNPYEQTSGQVAGSNNQASGIFSKMPMASNGTLLGTQFAVGPSVGGQQDNNVTPQNQVNSKGSWNVGGGIARSALGTPSFFKQKMTSTNPKPLPNNNMGA